MKNCHKQNNCRLHRRKNYTRIKYSLILFVLLMYVFTIGICMERKCLAKPQIISPIVAHAQTSDLEATTSKSVSATPTPAVGNPSPVQKGKSLDRERDRRIEKADPTELEKIVAYIARKFEPEGKDVVVRAINCFYSESGLRADAVGQNTDKHKSKDHGVAQLNDYWHRLTPEEKTDIYANIDKAYEIYKGRGDNFSAWYGKLCNI